MLRDYVDELKEVNRVKDHISYLLRERHLDDIHRYLDSIPQNIRDKAVYEIALESANTMSKNSLENRCCTNCQH